MVTDAWTTGVICAVAAGLCWCTLGIIFSGVARRRSDFAGMMAAASVCMAVAAWVLFARWEAWTATEPAARAQFVSIIGVTGVLVVLGSIFLQLAMRAGHHGTSWAIGQSAMVVPVVVGVLVWGETLSVVRWVGLICVVVALRLLAGNRSGDGPGKSRHAVLWAVGAFACWGTQQSLLATQSYLAQLAPLYSWRIPVATTASCLTWMVYILWRRRWPDAVAWRLGAVCAGLLVTGYWLMFTGLDALGTVGAASLFFPMAVGTSIMAFTIYSLTRERWTLSGVIGLVLGVAGLICLGVAK